jgi:hypothetical protein
LPTTAPTRARAGADARAVEEYVLAGVTRCVFRLPAAAADQVLPALDQAARITDQFDPVSPR